MALSDFQDVVYMQKIRINDENWPTIYIHIFLHKITSMYASYNSVDKRKFILHGYIFKEPAHRARASARAGSPHGIYRCIQSSFSAYRFFKILISFFFYLMFMQNFIFSM